MYAKRIARLEPSLSAFEPHERETIEQAARAYDEMIEAHYAGHNQPARTIRFKEIVQINPALDGPIDDFIRSGRFKNELWWSTSNSPFNGRLADITSETSRSPLRKLYGPGAKRQIFWPKLSQPVRGKGPGEIAFWRIHIAKNFDASGKARSLELLARDSQGEAQGFFYEMTTATSGEEVFLLKPSLH